MSNNPYDRIRDARAEIVAGALSAAHDLITSSVADVVSIRMNNNDEGGLYWSYRTSADPDGEWIDVEDERTPDGKHLVDELYDASSGIGLTWLAEVEPYLQVKVGPENYSYGPSMPIDKYESEFVHADLDLDAMRTAYEPYSQAEQRGYDDDLSKIVLVYADEEGTLYEQPLTDLTSSGTLIDPETGDDLDLVGWKKV